MIHELITNSGDIFGYFCSGAVGSDRFRKMLEAHCDLPVEEICDDFATQVGWYKFVKVEGKEYDQEWQECQPEDSGAFLATFLKVVA